MHAGLKTYHKRDGIVFGKIAVTTNWQLLIIFFCVYGGKTSSYAPCWSIFPAE